MATMQQEQEQEQEEQPSSSQQQQPSSSSQQQQRTRSCPTNTLHLLSMVLGGWATAQTAQA